MRTKVVAVLSAVAMAIGLGAFALSLSTTASAAADDPALAGKRVWCIDANGLPHYLPSPCSGYKGMWFFGTSLGGGNGGTPGPVGPRGPAGPAGKDGDSAMVIKRASITLTSSSPASTSVTVSDLPRFLASNGQIFGSNVDGAPTGVKVEVNSPTPSAGSTTRVFNLSGIVVPAHKKFTLEVWAAGVA
ncbi:MAG: hypothetical protein QG622_1400 [Actinomycetota bacterium]|nr:hypothetical protein [Actinomycetota bacterium]